MSDPHEEPDWKFDHPAIESAEDQQQEEGEHQQEADIIALSGSGGEPHSFSSSDVALTDYFPDIFFQTFPPLVTRASAGLSIREPEQPTSAPALEFGQSSKGKRKAGDIEPPQALVVTSQTEEITEERARELEREQLAEESGRQKRVRSTQVHNINERRRRGRITEKIQVLGNLIPSCKKTEIASILDEAIVYIRALKLQTQMMSMNMDPLQQQQQVFPYFPPYLPLPMTHWLGHHPMFALPSPAFNFPPDTASYRSRPASFPFFQPQITPFIIQQQLLGMSESSSAALARSFSFPASVSEQISQPQITPLQQQLLDMSSEAAEAAARSVSLPSSVSEQIFAFNQSRFGESISQRLSSSSHSLPIIRQGPLPFSTSYTVHATHVIPPTDPEFPKFDDEADCSKSEG